MYRRTLPHWHPRFAAFFVTWRLHGSLPRSAPRIGDGETFVTADRMLDHAQHGPAWLKRPDIAECVVHVLESAEVQRKLCDIHAYIVMSNHVHALLVPHKPLAEVMHWIKGVSAREANCLSEGEARRIVQYILNNPVKAGLAGCPEDWPYSSLKRRATG